MALTVNLTGKGQEQAPRGPGQIAFCADWDNEYVAFEGGWGAGKTWAGSRKLVTLHLFNSFDEYGRPTNVPSVGVPPTYSNAHDFMIPDLLETCDMMKIPAIYLESKHNIVFRGRASTLAPIMIRTAERPDRITGWEVGAAWGDEPARWKHDRNNPLNDPLLQLEGRVRHPNARFLQLMFTYTNEGVDTRIYEEFHSDKPSHAIYRGKTKDNPDVRKRYESLRLQLTEENARQYLDGEALITGAGLVYTSFNIDDNVDDSLELDTNLDLHMSTDFNIAPGMHAEIGHYNAAKDLFTVVHEIYAPRMTVIDMVHKFKEIVEHEDGFRWSVLHLYGDATGETQHWAATGQSCYEILMEGLQHIGVPFKLHIPSHNPPVVDRVNAFNVALKDIKGDVHWKCHSRCERLIADMKLMKRDRQGDIDKGEKKLSHASDAEGYRINYLRPARIQRREIGGRVSVKLRGR